MSCDNVSEDKVIVVASALFNWSETHRMVGFGKELSKRGYKIVFLGEGKYDYLLKDTSFERVIPKCDKAWFTEERIKKMMDIDHYGNDYASYDELKEVVDEEVDIFKKYNPVAAVTGYRTTLSLSARIAKVSLVWCLSAVVSPMYFTLNLASLPEGRAINKFLSTCKMDAQKEAYMKKFMAKMALIYNKTSTVWNKLFKENKLPVLKNDMEIFSGDLNLMSDASELFQEFPKDNEKYKFCGPIFNREIIEMPEVVKNYKKTDDRKVIFVVLGSSGEREVFLKILDSLINSNYDIFAAKVGIINDEDIAKYPSNYYFCDRFPMLDMMDIADACIIHGGQGTVYSTILSGKPFVGIPMFNEQQYNLENLQRKKCGIMLKKKEVNEDKVRESLVKVLTDSVYKENMTNIKNQVEKYYNDKAYSADIIAANYIEELINK